MSLDLTLALVIILNYHPALAKEYSEVILLPVGQTLLVALSSHSASAREHPEVVLLPMVLT